MRNTINQGKSTCEVERGCVTTGTIDDKFWQSLEQHLNENLTLLSHAVSSSQLYNVLKDLKFSSCIPTCRNYFWKPLGFYSTCRTIFRNPQHWISCRNYS